MKSKKRLCVILLSMVSLVSINSTILVYGYNFDTILICDEVDISTNKPIGVGYVHLTYSGYIYCWINLTDVVRPLAIKFDWIQPNEELYRSSVIYTKSGSFPLLSVYDLIKVAANDPASNPGKWDVEVYVDGVLSARSEFYIVDYGDVIENINKLVANVENLTISNNQIMSQHVSLQGDYNELLLSYEDLIYAYNLMRDDYNSMTYQKNELEKQYQTLNSDYDKLAMSYSDLLDNYDELVYNYDSIVKKLNNSRNTMYGAIFGMMILIAVVVYLFKQ